MFRLHSIVFKDDENERTLEVRLDGHVVSNETFSADEFSTCCFHSNLLVAGGISELEKFLKNQ